MSLPSDRTAGFWIDHLELIAHPEGGHYRQTYRAPEAIGTGGLPPRFAGGERAFATAIYFLLQAGEVSALHRLRADELWHFHCGGPLLVHALRPDGSLWTQRVGGDPGRGEALQAHVPHGLWFGSELEPPATYALVSCTVAPGFDFADFEMGSRADLVRAFPAQRALIERLTRE